MVIKKLGKINLLLLILLICISASAAVAPAAAEPDAPAPAIPTAAHVTNPTSAVTATQPSGGAFAEPRNIYIGDIFTLLIAPTEMTSDELRDRFNEFEIVEIKRDGGGSGSGGGWLVSLRAFEAGEKVVVVGNNKIVITVASTLDDIQRDGIFEGGGEIVEPGFPFHWHILFYVALGVFAASGGVVLFRFIQKKRGKVESAYEVFVRRSASLSPGNDNYLVAMTFYFKDYLGDVYNHIIIGKTTAEIMNELRSVSASREFLADIHAWLVECDRMKFTGALCNDEDKGALYNALLQIVERIEKQYRAAIAAA